MMRAARIVLVSAMLGALALAPAQAEVRILASPGGEVGSFLKLFERVRASGERVVIDGPCLSACTLVLEHGAERAHLRHAPGGAGISRRPLGRPARAVLFRAGSHRIRAAGLSRRGAGLDSPPRRIDLAPAAIARARARMRSIRAAGERDRLSGVTAPPATSPSRECRTCRRTCQNPWRRRSCAKAMLTLPPSLSALNLRSASAGSSIMSETENPCGWWKWPGGASEPISTSPSSDMRACMIFFFQSGGVGMSGGALSCVIIISILAPSAFS